MNPGADEKPAGPTGAPTAVVAETVTPRPPPWWKTLRADAPVLFRIAIGATSIGLALFIWWLLTRGAGEPGMPDGPFISPGTLPSPSAVFGSLGELLARDLDTAILDSLIRVLKGVMLAAVIGISLGVVSASFKALAAAMQPFVLFLRSVPMSAMVFVTMGMFGTGEPGKWKFICLAVTPFVFSDTVKAMAMVPQRYVETAETLGASRFQIVIKVLFPLAIPDIITSLRFQFGLAFGYIVLAESVNSDTGVGVLLATGEKKGFLEQNILILVSIALLAFAIDWFVRFAQRGFFPYRKDL